MVNDASGATQEASPTIVFYLMCKVSPSDVSPETSQARPTPVLTFRHSQ